MGHSKVGAAELGALAAAAQQDFIWLPGPPGRYGRAAAATNSDRLASVQGEFDGVVAEMEKEAARALKLDHKARSRPPATLSPHPQPQLTINL